MAVKIRMTRMGRRHRPFFRINAVESRTPRDGKILEKLGHYDPLEKDPQKQVVLNIERVRHWLDSGAIPSDTVSQLLLRLGIKHKYAEQKAARRQKAKKIARAQGRFFTKAEKIAADKAAEAAKEQATAEAVESKTPAEAAPQAQPAQTEPAPEPEQAPAETEKKAESAEVKPEEKPEPAAEKPTEQGKGEEKPESESAEDKSGPEPQIEAGQADQPAAEAEQEPPDGAQENKA